VVQVILLVEMLQVELVLVVVVAVAVAVGEQVEVLQEMEQLQQQLLE
jgi:hypothetical protein